MNSRLKLVAISIALTLAAGACGSPDAVASETVTSDTPSTGPAAAIEPAEEPVETSTTVVEEATTTTAAPETTTTIAVPSAEGFAAPAGPVIDGSMGPDEIYAMLDEAYNATDNLGGHMARVLPFPDITDFPDTEVTWVTSAYGLEFGNEEHGFREFQILQFETSASIEEVSTALSADFEAAGHAQESRVFSDDGTEGWVDHGFFLAWFEIVESGKVQVEINYSQLRDGVLDERPAVDYQAMFEGLIAASPPLEGHELTGFDLTAKEDVTFAASKVTSEEFSTVSLGGTLTERATSIGFTEVDGPESTTRRYFVDQDGGEVYVDGEVARGPDGSRIPVQSTLFNFPSQRR